MKAWEDTLTNHKELPTWDQMNMFLSSRVQREVYNSKTQVLHSQDKIETKCLKCQQDHFLWQCQKFHNMQVKERSNFVMTKGCCLNCPSKRTCKKCHKKHHTLLHVEREDRNNSIQQSNIASTSNDSRNHSNQFQISEDINAHFSRS